MTVPAQAALDRLTRAAGRVAQTDADLEAGEARLAASVLVANNTVIRAELEELHGAYEGLLEAVAPGCAGDWDDAAAKLSLRADANAERLPDIHEHDRLEYRAAIGAFGTVLR